MTGLAARQLDQALERTAAGYGRAAGRPESGMVSSMHGAILGLQRSAGNQAVASLFSNGQPQVALASPPRTPFLALQRCGGTPCGCASSEQPSAFDRPEHDAIAQRQDDSDQESANSTADGNQQTSEPRQLAPADGADPIVTYDGLDELQDAEGGQASSTAQLQRDGADAGAAAPVRTGTTCRVFTNFADFFQGAAPRSPFAAQTVFHFRVREGRIAVDEDRSASWVNRQRVPADGRRLAATAGVVRDCQNTFRQPNVANYTTTPQPDTNRPCPASDAMHNAATATSRGECDSVIGAQLDAEDQADMARLLRHEQYHLNLACALATLGNNQIDQGTAVADVRNQVVSASQRLQAAYDSDTNHGCDTGAQATWEANVDSRSLPFP